MKIVTRRVSEGVCLGWAAVVPRLRVGLGWTLAYASGCDGMRIMMRRVSEGCGLGLVAELAVPEAVAEIDYEADHEP
jgi:hypothetical protein